MNTQNKVRNARVSEEFLKELKKIQAVRKATVDIDLPREISLGRVTNFIIRTPEWETIKLRLIKEERKDKRII